MTFFAEQLTQLIKLMHHSCSHICSSLAATKKKEGGDQIMNWKMMQSCLIHAHRKTIHLSLEHSLRMNDISTISQTKDQIEKV